MKHTMQDLYQMQALPLRAKVEMTRQRVKGWIDEYGEDGVYISFSGGKDSTVLLDIVRKDYPDIPAVFVDVPTQYPELRTFATSFPNVTVIRPKISFIEVCEKYGFPLISKEVAERVYYAQKYLTWWKENNTFATDRQTDRQTDRKPPTDYSIWELLGVRTNRGGHPVEDIPDEIVREILETSDLYKVREMLGKTTYGNGKESSYKFSKWLFMVNAPFYVGNKCCDVMKKRPAHAYQRETGRKCITAEMASESRLRTQKWLQNGCNGFDLETPKSMPMAFWTEQDVLLYIYENKLPICSVYGDVVPESEINGQLDLADLGLFDIGAPVLKTTGCKRTGCMLCGFGCHLEKPGEGRFELLKKTHPGMYRLLDTVKNNGYTMRQAIDWMNEHGNTNIRY